MNKGQVEVQAFGGGLWLVIFPPSKVERIFFGNVGRPVFVHAKDKKQAVRKALRKIGRK